MQVPLQIDYRDVEKSDHIESMIREKVASLEKVCDYMVSCRIAVERPHEHQQTGRPYRLRILVRVPPQHEIVVERKATEGEIHDPLGRVIRDGFEAARRQLRELVEKQHGQVKSHPERDEKGFVTQLFPEEGYGFFRTTEGRDIYFHEHAVLNHDFGRLEIGTGVRFAEEMGNEGPQATTVEIVDKPGARAGKAQGNGKE